MNNAKKDGKIVGVVDAYRTGQYLALELKKNGYQCINIKSSHNLPKFLLSSFDKEIFLECIDYENNLPELIFQLKSRDVKFILAGTETGVELADQLSFHLELKGNDPKTTELRRNKYLMHMALAHAGLKIPSQFRCNDADGIVEWVNNSPNMRWPVVIKPLNSFATDGLSFCNDVIEIKEAVKRQLGKRNIIGNITNTEMLAQEYIHGIEYVVNTVSWNGVHAVTDMWKYRKRPVNGAGAVYDWQELIEIYGDIQDEIKNYIFNSLDAIGLKYGPGHSEVMYTEKGPILIEIGARAQGGIDPKVLTECTGTNQIEITVDTYSKATIDSCFDKLRKNLSKNAVWMNFIVNEDSILSDAESFLDRIKGFESFYSVSTKMKNGDLLKKTIDLETSPGAIFLVHSDQKVIERDYLAIRQLELEYFKQKNYS